jgi:hypothetical protein
MELIVMKKGFILVLAFLFVLSSSITSFAIDYADYEENVAVFSSSGTAPTNGLKTVIYVSPEDMGRTPGEFEKGMYIAAGSGIYVSADGVNWMVKSNSADPYGIYSRAYEHFAARETSIRQVIAYGGTDEKMMIATGATTGSANSNISSNLYVFSADLSSKKTAQAYTLNSQGQTVYLCVSTIVWDRYTQKFWCSANELSAASGAQAVDYAGIYYSDGQVVDGKMLWAKVDLGEEGNLYLDTARDKNWCIYPYISTNHNGKLTYFASYVYTNGVANRSKFGIISTNADASEISVNTVNLDGIYVYEQGSDTGTILNDYSTGSNTYGKAAVTGAALDGNGNVILGITGTNNPTDTRIVRYEISTGRLYWINDSAKTLGTRKIVVSNGQYAAAVALDAQTYTSAGRNNGVYNLTAYNFNNGNYEDGQLLLNESQEKIVYGETIRSDNFDHVFITSMAIGQDGTIVLTQTLRDTSNGPFRGRLITLKPEQVLGDDGEQTSQYAFYYKEKASSGDYKMLVNFLVRVNQDDVWSSSSKGVVMVREQAMSFSGVTTYEKWNGTKDNNGKWLDIGLDYEILPTSAADGHFDSSRFKITGTNGVQVNDHFIANARQIRIIMPTVTQAESGKLRIRMSQSGNRAWFYETDFAFTVIPDEYITVNDVEYISAEAASLGLQSGDNIVKAKYNLRPANDVTNARIFAALYKKVGEVPVLVDVEILEAGTIAANAANEALPELTATFNIPQGDNPSDYFLKTFYWSNMIPY